ncbi:MAG: methyltransferase domain-containing protein [Nanoarchaeota archaeon]
MNNDILLKLKPLEQQSISRKIPIIGLEKGAWLLKKVQETKPKKILELGTANGYSGCILGSEGAELTTIELNPTIAEEAKINFKEHDINAKILIGDGAEIIKQLAEEKQDYFDLIFIDFAKKKYLSVLEPCIKLLKKGGFIIADNISMEGCKDYKQVVSKHPQLKTEIIKIKDGLSCSRKND